MARPTHRPLIVALGIAFAGLGAVAFLSASDAGDSAAERDRRTVDRAGPVDAAPSLSLITASTAPSASAGARSRDVARTVRPRDGRVVAIDLRGGERTDANGRLRLRVRPRVPGAEPVERWVDVTSGAFRPPSVPGPGRIDVLEGRLAGRSVSPATDALRTDAAGAPVSPLRVRLRTRARFAVLDARTGDDVTSVRFVRGAPLAVVPVYPGDDAPLLVEGVDSPLELELDPWKDYPLGLYVGAPGYAWQLTMATAEEEVERVVLLEPGGSLEVFVDDAAGLTNAFLRVRPTGDGRRGLSFNAPLRDAVEAAPLTLRSLLPTEYEISIAVDADGDRTTLPTVVARAGATVTPGATETVRLTIPEAFASAATTADVTLDLVVPEAWPREAVDVRLTAVGVGHPDRQQSTVEAAPVENTDRFRADVEGLPLGEYELWIQEFAHRERIVVDRDDAVTVTLPIPAEAEIRLTEEQAAASRWTVSFRSEDTGAFGSAERVEGDPLLQRFVAPPGVVDLTLLGPGGQQFRGRGRVGGGRAFLTLDECVSVRLRTTYRGRPHPVATESATPRTPDVKGPGRLVRSAAEWSVDNDVQILVLSAPGRYVIRPAALPGYVAPESLEVTLAPGTIPEIEVPLRRLR